MATSEYMVFDVTTGAEIAHGYGSKVQLRAKAGNSILANDRLMTVLHVLHVMPLHDRIKNDGLFCNSSECQEMNFDVIFVKPLRSEYDITKVLEEVEMWADKYGSGWR